MIYKRSIFLLLLQMMRIAERIDYTKRDKKNKKYYGNILYDMLLCGSNPACGEDIKNFKKNNLKQIKKGTNTGLPQQIDDPPHIPYYYVRHINQQCPAQTGTYLTTHTMLEYAWFEFRKPISQPGDVKLFTQKEFQWIFWFILFITQVGVHSRHRYNRNSSYDGNFIPARDYNVKSLDFLQHWTIKECLNQILVFTAHITKDRQSLWKKYRGHSETSRVDISILSNNLWGNWCLVDLFFTSYLKHIHQIHQNILVQDDDNNDNDDNKDTLDTSFLDDLALHFDMKQQQPTTTTTATSTSSSQKKKKKSKKKKKKS